MANAHSGTLLRLGRNSDLPCYGSNPILGSLSAKYESGGWGPGTINPYRTNHGDPGGASYGTFQIATVPGTMGRFLTYLERENPVIYQEFVGLRPATDEFDETWVRIAQEQPEVFEQVQHKFIKLTHYDQALINLESTHNIDLHVEERAHVIKDVIWSTAVQHGPTNGSTLIKRAIGGREEVSDIDLIHAIYRERGADNGMRYFSKCSPSVRMSVVNRFVREEQDALSLLEQETMDAFLM